MTGDKEHPDISADARSLARMADRLPCGETVVIIKKPPRPDRWTIIVAPVTQTKETGANQ